MEDNKEKELEDQLKAEFEKQKQEQELEIRVNEMMKNLSPVEFYKNAFDEGWDQGFGCGMDAELEELYEAGEKLGNLHLHALSDMIDAIDEKHSEGCEHCGNKEEDKISG